MQSTRYFRPILMELEFSRKIFEKYSNIKFHENPSSGSQAVTFGQMEGPAGGRTDVRTDRYEEANGLFSQFCDRA
jgi:hypothetical protein